MRDCKRTAVEIALTGVGWCACRHSIRKHDLGGCKACAAEVDRPRAYAGRPAAYDPRRRLVRWSK